MYEVPTPGYGVEDDDDELWNGIGVTDSPVRPRVLSTYLESETVRCPLGAGLGESASATLFPPPELQLGNQFWMITCFLSATCFLVPFPAET